MTVTTATTKDIVINQMVVTLTDEDIKTLPGTPFEVLPAPGSGKMNIVHTTIVTWKLVDTYGNLGGERLLLTYGDYNAEASGLFSMPSTSDVRMNIITPPSFVTADPDNWGQINEAAAPFQSSSFENVPVKVYSSKPAVYDGGNPANTLTIIVFYSVLDI